MSRKSFEECPKHSTCATGLFEGLDDELRSLVMDTPSGPLIDFELIPTSLLSLLDEVSELPLPLFTVHEASSASGVLPSGDLGLSPSAAVLANVPSQVFDSTLADITKLSKPKRTRSGGTAERSESQGGLAQKSSSLTKGCRKNKASSKSSHGPGLFGRAARKETTIAASDTHKTLIIFEEDRRLFNRYQGEADIPEEKRVKLEHFITCSPQTRSDWCSLHGAPKEAISVLLRRIKNRGYTRDSRSRKKKASAETANSARAEYPKPGSSS